MAQKITQSQIEQMLTLYEQIGTYSGVAKQMGISAATVSRYIKATQFSPIIKPTITQTITPKPIEQIDFQSLLTFSNLTQEEQNSYDAWLKEFN